MDSRDRPQLPGSLMPPPADHQRRFRPAVTSGGHGRPAPEEADPTTPPPPRFSFAVGRALGTAVVTVHGAVDHFGAERLEDVLGDLIDRESSLLRVVVDLRDACGIHPAGLCLFEAAAGRARQRGIAFEVHGAPAAVFQAFEAAGRATDCHAAGP